MPRALLTLSIQPNAYAVCRLEPKEGIPSWAPQGAFWSIIGTPDELSIVCQESSVPSSVKREGGWRVLKCEGPLDFALTGIMASIADPLADAGVSIFPLSTYDTDYVLVKESQLQTCRNALASYGHVVHG